MATIRAIFLKIRKLFPSFRERAWGDLPPSFLQLYTCIVIIACRVLLLTKFNIMKLKTDVFSVSATFL